MSDRQIRIMLTVEVHSLRADAPVDACTKMLLSSIAGIVCFLDDSGEPAAADALEAALFRRLVPPISKPAPRTKRYRRATRALAGMGVEIPS